MQLEVILAGNRIATCVMKTESGMTCAIQTALKKSARHAKSGTVPRLPVPRLPPGGSLGTPKILSTGATLHLGPIRLHVENWECRALKSSARCQKLGVPCRLI